MVKLFLIENASLSACFNAKSKDCGWNKAPARLAQLEERRSDEREFASSNPGRTNTQGL